ncbi:MAG TPA: hypothetical protein VL754_21145 [Verrucomicrobiae bacterium]|jgi:hypothetical protein|nr:hypothetical protein [Verrucomicrobiae bacterium]
MNYLQPYMAASADQTVLSAWDTQVAHAPEAPWLDRLLIERGSEIFAEFSARYNELRALPRSARRALQRSLARSRELTTVPAEWRRKLAYTLAGAALLLALGGAAQAATINVTAKTPPGISPGDGKCSLAEAIIAANTDAPYDYCSTGFGPDTIVLPIGSQAITSSFGFYYGGNTGLPLITSNITIEGNGAKVSRKSKAAFRLMAVGATGNLTLNNVSVSKGLLTTYGAAIHNAGYLTINDSIITGNISGKGAISNSRYLTISSSTLSKNTASSYGGAIYNLGTIPGYYGSLILNSSTITGNKAAAGGGIFSAGYYADVFINSSIFSKNTASIGGAIANDNGYMKIDPTTITGNKASVGGGAVNLYGTLFINYSTISKNSAGVGGGVVNLDGTLKVLDSSVITGNKASSSGGGVANCGYFRLADSSITLNSAKLAGGGLLNFNDSTPPYTCYYTFTYTNSTITGNKAKYGPDRFDSP